MTSMNENEMKKVMMWSAAVLSVLAGAGAVLLLIATVTQSMLLVLPCLLLAAGTLGFGYAAVYFGRNAPDEPRLSSRTEREVLNGKQQRELRRRRGEVVMERALIEVEHERDNITHRQIEASKDPDKPPHKTQWTPDDGRWDGRKEIP